MSILFIMLLWLCFTNCGKLYKKHVSNSVLPTTGDPSYNISSWVRQLHLQQCALVEVGEKYCGVYLEYRTLSLLLGLDVQEYFLGLCDTETLRKWKFCSADLEKERPNECTFDENTETTDNPSRVHRRLCDITALAFHGELCNCSQDFAGEKLHRVTGFPTCFLPPLPETLCEPRNVCGVGACNATTVSHQIHTISCNPKCVGGQPFCELPGQLTAQPSKIESFWSDWSQDVYDSNQTTNAKDFRYTEAMCINKNSGLGAIDCLGPGTNCCPYGTEECKCFIYIEDGILKLSRKYKIKQPTTREKDLEYYKSVIKQRESIYNRNIGSKKVGLLIGGDQRKREEEEYDDGDDDEEDTDSDDVILEDNSDDNEDHVTPKSFDKDDNENRTLEILHEESAFDDAKNFSNLSCSTRIFGSIWVLVLHVAFTQI